MFWTWQESLAVIVEEVIEALGLEEEADGDSKGEWGGCLRGKYVPRAPLICIALELHCREETSCHSDPHLQDWVCFCSCSSPTP